MASGNVCIWLNGSDILDICIPKCIWIFQRFPDSFVIGTSYSVIIGFEARF